MQDDKIIFEKLALKYLLGEISNREERVLLKILQSDASYKQLLFEMAKIRAISHIPLLEATKNENYAELKRKIGGLQHFHKPFWIRFNRIAAIILLALTTGSSLYYLGREFLGDSSSNFVCETIVPPGSHSTVKLPDGTVVQLNSASTLRYDKSFGQALRSVTLSGEAYFEVTKNPRKPFVVNTQNLDVKVLGTKFNVRSYASDTNIEVNLISGSVQVSNDIDRHSAAVVLCPNEKLIYNKTDQSIQKYKSDASRAVQWTTGRLCFEDISIADLVKDLERKFDVEIVIESPQIKNEVFSGSINLSHTLPEILNYIDVDHKFKIINQGKVVYIKNE